MGNGLKTNEVAILKASSCKLDGTDLIVILTCFYHTVAAENKGNEKSWYRYEGIVLPEAKLKELAQEWDTPPKSKEPWRWPTQDPTWSPEWELTTGGQYFFAKGASWLNCKIKKALPWKEFYEHVHDGITRFKNGKVKTSETSKFPAETEPWFLDNGQPIANVYDPKFLASISGHTFHNQVQMKRELPSASARLKQIGVV